MKGTVNGIEENPDDCKVGCIDGCDEDVIRGADAIVEGAIVGSEIGIA